MFQMQITGLDDLHLQPHELIEVLRALNGPLCRVNFHPASPAQVEKAVNEMERAVDAKLASFAGSPWVEQLAAAVKQKLRDEIIQGASQARNKPPLSRGVPWPMGAPVPPINGTGVLPFGAHMSEFRFQPSKGGFK